MINGIRISPEFNKDPNKQNWKPAHSYNRPGSHANHQVGNQGPASSQFNQLLMTLMGKQK